MTYSQSFAWWSFVPGDEDPDRLLAAAALIGYRGVDFLPRPLWPRARDAGLELVVIDGHESIDVGFSDARRHAQLRDEVRGALELAVDEGVAFLAVASGNAPEPRAAADGIAVCAEGLAPVADEAVAAGVPLLLEPLNTKVDHPGHECDTTLWGAAVIDAVGSPGLRLIYDVYHMQLMEGDLVRTLEANFDRIAHVHTAGCPGRHELDDDQEVNWGHISRTLSRLDYGGYVAHEFIPRGDPRAALRDAFEIFATGQAEAAAQESGGRPEG
jgi:hydroxypyruvate isomerase